ncbi:hypothetical protein ACTA71_002352 [Dictyostelium dimigraforme]
MINLKSLEKIKKCVVPLKSRSLIKVVGQDSLKHLQGLTTNNLNRLKDNQSANTSIYNGFLQGNGRLLFDSIISLDREHHNGNPKPISMAPGSSSNSEMDSFIVDIDSSILEEAIAHLKQYKLRNKIDIIDVSENFNVYSILDKTYKTVRDDSLFAQLEKDQCSVMMDPRHQIMGVRLLVPNNKQLVIEERLSKYESKEEIIYNLFRISQGIPQGVKEYQWGNIIPLEYNFDLLNGVDFHKGCYLGQELTSRTHFTGLIRKRIFPVVMKVQDVESPSVMDEAIIDPTKPPKESLLFPKRILNALNLEHPASDSALSVKNVSPKHNNQQQSSDEPVKVGNDSEIKTVSRSTDKFITGLHGVGLAMLKVENIDIFQLDNTVVHDKSNKELTVLPPCWISKLTSLQMPPQQVS